MYNSLPLRELVSAYRSLFGRTDWRRPQLRLRAAFWRNGLSNLAQIESLAHTAPAAIAALRQDPAHLGILMWPLVDIRWIARKRLEMLKLHHQEAQTIGPATCLAMDETKPLVQCAGNLSELSICIERQGFFRREGQLALSVFHGSERMYSLAFLLSRQDNMRVAYVGAIQGVKQTDDNALYKSITRQAHGLRPRDLTISTFLLLCKALDVQDVFAVQNKHRQHWHRYFGQAANTRLSADYDAAWADHDGHLHATGFFRLPVGLRMKDPQDISSKKRSMYRKRYALLEDIESALARSISENSTILLADNSPESSDAT